jgi:hypothetical protein
MGSLEEEILCTPNRCDGGPCRNGCRNATLLDLVDRALDEWPLEELDKVLDQRLKDVEEVSEDTPEFVGSRGLGYESRLPKAPRPVRVELADDWYVHLLEMLR